MHWLIGHMVGDYLLQNDWQALNKKSSTLVCLVHVLLYTLSIWAFTSWPMWAMGIVAGTHFIQDRTGIIRAHMEAVGQDKFASGAMAPWSLVVIDNTFHLVVLFFLSLYCQAPEVVWLEW